MAHSNNDPTWWRGAVIYQIYPRSYQDTNKDGVGDLPGITKRLPYIASLGVDGIWISPFFKSPMKDFGYDVSDYRDVDPLFGTLDDFRTLLDKAHKLGLRVIMDMVISHTSDQHPWFQESRNPNNAKKDWYVWADPKPDGTPPTNWQSVFGGPAWTFNARRGQYFMHSFLSSQPDLNFHNPAVQDAILDDCKFWLDLGIDGLRLDACNHYFHDMQLRDNPPKPNAKGASGTQVSFPIPYGMQRHIYDKSQNENFAFLNRLRKLMDQYPGAFTVGEVGDDNSIALAAAYSAGDDYLNTCYQFSLLAGQKVQLTSDLIRNSLESFGASGPNSWPSWAFSNHDVVRATTRFGKDGRDNADLSKLVVALISSLRGTAFIYQGDELGLPEATIPFEKLQDPWGIALYPEWQGRDGCRTPMPWDESKFAGFSKTETWLPIPEEHKPLSVKAQDKAGDSVLNFTRMFIKWRRKHPVLRDGNITFINESSAETLVFERSSDNTRMLCLFNLSEESRTINGIETHWNTLLTPGQRNFVSSPAPSGEMTLPPYGFAYLLAAV